MPLQTCSPDRPCLAFMPESRQRHQTIDGWGNGLFPRPCGISLIKCSDNSPNALHGGLCDGTTSRRIAAPMARHIVTVDVLRLEQGGCDASGIVRGRWPCHV